MGRVDNVEPWAINQLRRNVRESLQSHGEEVIGLRMFHAGIAGDDVPRCHCFDDVYKQSSEYKCPDCYGTTYQGGVRQVLRLWAMFTDSDWDERKDKRGQYLPEQKQVQIEGDLQLIQNDYLIRVKKWSKDHRPLELGSRYVLGRTSHDSLRTGNQYGQTDADLVGHKSPVSALDPSHPIYLFPVPDFPVPSVIEKSPKQWFAGHGPPPDYIHGSKPGDGYLDIDSGTRYELEA
jgi:hypothetical protein